MRDLGSNRLLTPALADLRDRVRETVAASGPNERVKAVIEDFGERSRFATALREALAHPAFLDQEVSPRSYRHALGFDKFVLVSDRPVFQLRLHIWSPGQTYDVEHVHNHRFAFVSTVLAGELGMEIHTLDPSGADVARFDESLEPETLAWRFRELDPVGTRLGFAASLPEGSSYFLDGDAFHRVRVTPGKLTATLVVEMAWTRESTTVLVPAGLTPPPVAKERTPIGAEDCRAGLERLATALR